MMPLRLPDPPGKVPPRNGHRDPVEAVAVIESQQAQIESLKRERARLESECERLATRLRHAECNEYGLEARLSELQEVVMGRRPAPPPDRSWRTRIKWAMSILFATTSSPTYDIW